MSTEVGPTRLDLAPWERGLVLTDPRPRSVRDALHEVAHARPDHIAVDDGMQQLTYAQFVRATEHVAHVVRAATPDPNEPVTVVVTHGVDAVIAIVGVIVSGRIAVPVDRRDPVERLRAVHQEAGSSLIVSDAASEDAARAVAPDGPVVVLDEAALRSGTEPALRSGTEPALRSRTEPADDATSPRDEITIDPESLAILFFTSGSTGAPKGVHRTHRHAVRNACRHAYSLGLTPADRIGLEGSLGFSAAYTRVWTALLNGVTLCLYDVQREGARGIAAWANESGITITGFVPSVFRALAVAAPEAHVNSMRIVTFGGEALFGRDVRRARRMFGPDTELRNRMASTEASTVCTWIVTPDDEATDAPVPVGHAEPWLELRIVDGADNDVPEGEPGTMVVIDVNLSAGYWRDPQLTAERFFALPDGRRAFRTSDRVRIRSDGVLEHLGRADDRVKVRGAMTSPSEVERALVELDDIADAVVVASPTAEGGTRLVAYVVLRGSATPSGWQVRRDLAKWVQPHMVPSVVTVLDAFPVGSRGKIDRAALPPPPDPALRPYREPVGRERELAGLYMQVLGLDRVGLDDDFFELGGDSLAAVELIAAIDDRFGIAQLGSEAWLGGEVGARGERWGRLLMRLDAR
ncbi:MAG: non-ribosomal peptide synthetase, partial [Acidimicrobiia bacterium]